MSDKKISQLTASTTPLAGTEVLPVVQSGVTKQVSVANLTAGRNPVMNYALAQTGFQIQTGGVNRWIIEKGTGEGLFIYRYNDAGSYAGNPVQIDRANGNVRLENNLVIGTAGNGIDFSADPSAAGMTSELLDDYEEGTWTPDQGSGLVVVGDFSSTGKYTKIGRLVTVVGTVSASTSVSVSNGFATICTTLPFFSADNGGGSMFNVAANETGLVLSGGTTLFSASVIAATTNITFTLNYFV